MSLLDRFLEKDILDSLSQNPATAILGPRQCGKSTLAKKILERYQNSIYLDLERPSDQAKLDNAEWFLGSNADKLICLDEIQRHPDLFPLLRSLIDDDRRPNRFLILGSASQDVIRQSSESLAGRISYSYLSPFLLTELDERQSLEQYISRGGFPLALFSGNDNLSYKWRLDFISTFLERDLRQFAGFSSPTMRRLWQMLAHYNGQVVNYSRFGESLGVSHNTVRNYIDLLEATFMVKQIQPWSGNTKKRLVKSPKVYITDTGIITGLLQLKDFEIAAGHPVFGSLWETIVLQHIMAAAPNADIMYYRTNHGNEIDFIIQHEGEKIAVECKASKAPKLEKGNWSAIDDVNPDKIRILAPVDSSYSYYEKVEVLTIKDFVAELL